MRQLSPPVRLDVVVLIIALFSGWSIFGSVEAMNRGFPDPRLSDNQAWGMILYELFAFGLATVVLLSRGWRLEHFKCKVTWLFSFLGVLLLGVTWLLHIAIWELFGSWLGGRDLLIAFVRNTTLTFPMVLALSIVNGAFEEFFLTRFLLDALARYGASIAIGVSALIRVLTHVYQGPTGAVSILAFGLVLTLFYWRYRELWPVVFAHMLADLVALV
jgi:uncharacterized protein